MKRHLLTLVALVVAIAALPGSAMAVDNDNPAEGQTETGGAPVVTSDGSEIQWSLYAGGKPIAGATALSLRAHDGYLASGYQRFGINLQFYSGERRSWRIVRQPGASGSLRIGERVALFEVDARGYIAYTRREFGINLGSFATPKYEWELRGAASALNSTRPTVGLFDTIAGDYLVNADRPFGVSLRWSRDT
jgi:hypothetical protein